MPRFQNKASKTGTSTTETPVRKADFDGVVYFSPQSAVRSPQREDATRQPERSAPAVRLRQFTIKNHCQHHRRQAHADRVEEKRRNIRQRILDHDKSRAPDQRDHNQQNVGF